MIKLITELQAIAQSGLTYSNNQYDIERFKRLLEIAANLLSLKSNYKFEEILELFEKDSGYATPKVDVRGAVFKNDKILLVQEKSNNLWALPGGWADVNLSPAENTIKELKEESGFECAIIKLIGIFDKRKSNTLSTKWPHVYKIFFLCEIRKLVPKEFDKKEILNAKFFDYNDLPPLSEGRVNNKQIDICFKHHLNQQLSAEYE